MRLFLTLYPSWCHDPAALFSLCLYAQQHELCYKLVTACANIEMTVPTLLNLDKLVQLLESPIYTNLRLQLLEPTKFPHLFKMLTGLLMLLPQSAAFEVLRKRLKSVPVVSLIQVVLSLHACLNACRVSDAVCA